MISLSVCTCTHVRIGTVRMFFPFFVSDGHLCFSLIFFVILLAAQGSLCASTHVHQPSDGVGSGGGMGEETRPGETCERGRLSVVSGGRMQRQKVKNRESDGTLSFSPPRSATASANSRGWACDRRGRRRREYGIVVVEVVVVVVFRGRRVRLRRNRCRAGRQRRRRRRLRR